VTIAPVAKCFIARDASSFKMARNRDTGFHSAAGLIRYFDQEDEKALKVNPWFVVVLAIALSVVVLYLTYSSPV